MQLLLEKGCDAKQVRDDGSTPMYVACDRGHHEIVKQLLDNGCDVSQARDDGQTVTDAACLHIATALSQVRNAASDAGADRCLALLLASRRIDRGMLEYICVGW